MVWAAQAMRRNGRPGPSTLAGSATLAAAMKPDNEEQGTASVSRQGKSLHKIVEHAHRAVKRSTHPRLGLSWLRVFRRANPAHLGPSGGQEW